MSDEGAAHDLPLDDEVDDGAVDDVLARVLEEQGPRSPLEDDRGRLRLSFTRVDTFERCPRRFRYQYVDGLPQRPAPQLSFGSSVHDVLEWVYDRKLPELPSLDETLQRLFEVWDSSGYEDVPRDEQLSAYQHARDVITAAHSRITERGFRLPVSTEAWFELPFDEDVVVVGAIDRVDADDDGALHVVDYKTNRRARSRAQVKDSLQLAIYALATEELYGRLPRTVALDFVVPGVEVRVDVDDMDLGAVPGRLQAVARRIRAGEDTPTPHRLCDWCDFRSICPAWEGDGLAADDAADAVLGRAALERDRLRRSLVRDAHRLAQLQASVERLERELAGHSDGDGDA